MSETRTDQPGATAAAVLAHARALGEVLTGFDGHRPGGGWVDPGDLVEVLGVLEELKCRAEGAQVMASVALDATQRAAHAAVGDLLCISWTVILSLLCGLLS